MFTGHLFATRHRQSLARDVEPSNSFYVSKTTGALATFAGCRLARHGMARCLAMVALLAVRRKTQLIQRSFLASCARRSDTPQRLLGRFSLRVPQGRPVASRSLWSGPAARRACRCPASAECRYAGPAFEPLGRDARQLQAGDEEAPQAVKVGKQAITSRTGESSNPRSHRFFKPDWLALPKNRRRSQ